MMMPGLAPLIAAVKVPSTLTTRLPSIESVFSPKYQTMPSWSWANQSSVSSITLPSR